ncbi:MAG: M14 family metallopeptidase [Acidimicrobiales bacterium]|nr:M14 family metallopeptidase [Acidimicrobiales bacterium]
MSTPTRADKERLQQLGLDLTEHGDADSLEVVLYGEDDDRRLRDAGFTYTVRIGDLAARDAANRQADAQYAAATTASPLPSGRDSYRHLADYERELAELAKDHPTLARPITLNHRSWEGRSITGIEITREPDAEDGKPVFLMLGAHHAREWPSAEHSIEFAYDLIRGYGHDARTTALVDTTRTIVIPVVNPDGFVVSREARPGAASQEFSKHDFEMKRKNCRDVVGACDRRTRLSGVDLNRNYGGLWGGSGASPSVSSDVYRGPAPFSEPEVQGIRELIASRQVAVLVSNHTYSNLILRVPGTIAQGFPQEEPQAAALGEQMASRNGYDSIPGFGLYDTTGSTEDWSFWTAGALSYTFEIGPSEFHPPYETGVVAEYLGLSPAAGAGGGGNRAAYFDALEATANSSLHAVLTGTAPSGSRLSLTKTFETATSPVCADDFCNHVGEAQTFEDTLTSEMVTAGGAFTWHVNPSTRPIVAGRHGREPLAPAQPTITMVNDPAVVPEENIHYPWSPTPSRIDPPYETFQFEVKDPPTADNERVGVHIEWSDPATDWDLYLLDAAGELVTASALWGDNDEDVTLFDPAPGVYTAVVVSYDQADRTFDDWSGEVTFTGPSPATSGAEEAWLFRCETSDGVVVVGEIVVDRGQTVDLGQACGRSE